jgi:hypothetical protein
VGRVWPATGLAGSPTSRPATSTAIAAATRESCTIPDRRIRETARARPWTGRDSAVAGRLRNQPVSCAGSPVPWRIGSGRVTPPLRSRQIAGKSQDRGAPGWSGACRHRKSRAAAENSRGMPLWRGNNPLPYGVCGSTFSLFRSVTGARTRRGAGRSRNCRPGAPGRRPVRPSSRETGDFGVGVIGVGVIGST